MIHNLFLAVDMGGLRLYLNFLSGWISKADILKFDGSFKFVLFDAFF